MQENQVDRETQKEILRGQIVQYETAIQKQVADYKTTGKHLLYISGALAAIYLVLNSIPEDKEAPVSSKQKTASKDGVILSVVKGLATSFLLALAKKKLQEILENKLIDDKK
ncbi:MAG: hypothetical protein ACK4R6_07345 [Spirosomataceae bacterium]